MKLNIDVTSSPPSVESIYDLKKDRESLYKKLTGLSTWAGILALTCYICSYFKKEDWILYLFVPALIAFLVSYKYEKKLRISDDAVLGEVPAELNAQLFVYCQTTPVSMAYKEAVLKQRRPFIKSEYHALQKHAREAGCDEGVSMLYNG